MLAERIGAHRVMAASSLGLFASFVLLSLSPGLGASCVLFALCGLANGLGWPPLMIWRNRLVPSRIRASALALFASFTYLAGAAASMVLGAVLDTASSTAGFILAALIALTSVPLYLKAANKKQAEGASPAAGPA
jgi:MFS family permease